MAGIIGKIEFSKEDNYAFTNALINKLAIAECSFYRCKYCNQIPCLAKYTDGAGAKHYAYCCGCGKEKSEWFDHVNDAAFDWNRRNKQ